MGGDDKRTAVAILVKNPSQWRGARRTARELLSSGATVTLFCLGHEPMTMEIRPGDSLGIEYCADTCQAGMRSMSLEEIARKLKRCDLVIPI